MFTARKKIRSGPLFGKKKKKKRKRLLIHICTARVIHMLRRLNIGAHFDKKKKPNGKKKPNNIKGVKKEELAK